MSSEAPSGDTVPVDSHALGEKHDPDAAADGSDAAGAPKSARATSDGLDPVLVARVVAGVVLVAAITAVIVAPDRVLAAVLLAPVILGALAPLGRWTDGTDRVNGLSGYLEQGLAKATEGPGKFKRYFLRPLFAGTLWIWSRTAPVTDSHLRAGLRVALSLVFGALMLATLAIVGYVLLIVVVALAMAAFVIKLLFEFLSDSLGGNRSSSSQDGRDDEEMRPEPAVVGLRGSRVVQEGFFVDTPTGAAINSEGQIVSEGFFVDTPTGRRIDEEGRLVDEGLFFDTPTGIRLQEDGRIVEEGLFVDTPTGKRIDEEGRLVEEGLFVDTPTGTRFVKE
jgi:hypothetical protein